MGKESNYTQRHRITRIFQLRMVAKNLLRHNCIKIKSRFSPVFFVISSLTGEADSFEVKGKYQINVPVPGGPGGAVPFDALPYCRYHHKFWIWKYYLTFINLQIILFLTALFRFRFQWLVLVTIGLALSGSNMLGYLRCRLGSKGGTADGVKSMANAYLQVWSLLQFYSVCFSQPMRYPLVIKAK